MNRKLKWLITAGVAALLVIAIAIPAFAAGPNGTNGSTLMGQAGFGNCQGLGFGPNEAAAELLGMTQEQIQEQRQAGMSLVQIAATKNISEEALISAIMADKQESIQSLVNAGTITQTQAELRLEQMKERVQLAVNRTTVGPPDWAGANGNRQNGTGMMSQSGLRGNQENCTGTPGTCTGVGGMMRSGRTAR
jgi:hypothetical protein